MTGRIPADSEAEESLLGSMLLSRTGVETALGTVTESDLYGAANRRIYAAVAELWGEGSAVDVQTVASRLDRAGDLARSGGKARLLALEASTPASANAAHYAALVVECSTARRAMGLAHDLDTAARAQDLAEVRRLLASGADSLAASIAVEPADEVADLVGRDVEADWIVPGLLERGDRLILTGREGGGKSTWGRQIAAQCASGIHPTTRRPMPALVVLHVDCENSPAQTIRGYRQLLTAAGERYERAHLFVKSRHDGIDLLQLRDERWLDALLAQHHPDLVVIGPLYKLFVEPRSYDEGSARAAAAALDRLRVRHRCALLIEAHSPHGKEGDRANYRPIGASLWLRWPEFGLALKPEPKAAEVIVWKTRDRDRRWPTRLIEGTAWPWELPLDETMALADTMTPF